MVSINTKELKAPSHAALLADAVVNLKECQKLFRQALRDARRTLRQYKQRLSDLPEDEQQRMEALFGSFGLDMLSLHPKRGEQEWLDLQLDRFLAELYAATGKLALRNDDVHRAARLVIALDTGQMLEEVLVA